MSAAARLGRAWRALPAERRLAVVAAVALVVSLFLPWYQKNASVGGSRELVSVNLSALAVFTFVEGAILVVAGAVLALLFLRAERRAFHLPGGDGTIVTIAGAWATLLVVWRLFDKPGVAGDDRFANVGIQWGIVVALVAAGLLAYAGVRMRASHRGEPAPARERPPAPARGSATGSVRPRSQRAHAVDPSADRPDAASTERLDDPTAPLGDRAASRPPERRRRERSPAERLDEELTVRLPARGADDRRPR